MPPSSVVLHRHPLVADYAVSDRCWSEVWRQVEPRIAFYEDARQTDPGKRRLAFLSCAFSQVQFSIDVVLWRWPIPQGAWFEPDTYSGCRRIRLEVLAILRRGERAAL